VKKIITAVLLIFCCSFLRAADYDEELLHLSELTSNKDYDGAIKGYQALADETSTPQWLKASAYFEIASIKLQQGKKEEGLASIDKAVELGFDDCIAIQQDAFAELKGSKEIASRLDRMKISEADYHELFWLKSEMQNLEHDIKMMITENINRADSDFTETPQSQIPSRETKSASVLYARANVKLMQEIQKKYVKQSDEERIQHNATMGIVGGGPNQQAILISKQEAAERAESRRKDVLRRVYKEQPGDSGELKSCSSYTVQ
jgi:tetratricopeptide (TPR) repeat protein